MMITEFKQELEKLNTPEATIRGYISDLRGCINKGIIEEKLENNNINKIFDINVSIPTKQRWMYAIKKYAKFMLFNRYIDKISPEILYLQLPKKEQKIFNVIPKEKIKLNIQNKEINALISILYSTGARINSISNLKVSDIKDNYIIFNNVKNNKPYISVLLHSTKQAIQEYLKTKENTEYLFTSNNKRATANCLRKRLKKYMGENYINPHMYRHRLATDLIENGMEINDVATVLNHKNLSTTQQYVHVSISSKENKLQKVHPMLKSTK